MTTEHGAFVIAAREALVPARYRDMVGVDTWGVGHTHNAGSPDPRSMGYAMPSDLKLAYREAWAIFKKDLRAYVSDVVRVFGADLAPHELDGLTSWHFNTGGAHSSRAGALWRAGDKKGAVAAISAWNKGTVNGQKVVISDLVDRRAMEAKLILTGVYPDRAMAIYGTDGRGNVVWRPIETFTWDRWRKFINGSQGFVETPRPTAPKPPAAPRPAAIPTPGEATGLAAAIAAIVAGVATSITAYWDDIRGWFEALTGGLW